MTAPHITAGRRSTTGADVITYRLEEKMVYVPLALNWAEALEHVQGAFEELGKIDKKRIKFFVNIMRDQQRVAVGISPSAWPSVASHLARYEIIDIVVTPDPVISEGVVSNVDVPPPVYSSSSVLPFTQVSARSKERRQNVTEDDSSMAGQRCSRSPSKAGLGGSCKFSPKRMLQKLWRRHLV
ncbi:hypothetical protein V8B97DRAFT_1025013 [Scleroderma yunnanense]